MRASSERSDQSSGICGLLAGIAGDASSAPKSSVARPSGRSASREALRQSARDERGSILWLGRCGAAAVGRRLPLVHGQASCVTRRCRRLIRPRSNVPGARLDEPCRFGNAALALLPGVPRAARIRPAIFARDPPRVSGSKFLRPACGSKVGHARDSRVGRWSSRASSRAVPACPPGAPQLYRKLPFEIELEDSIRGRVAHPDEPVLVDEVIHHQRGLARRPMRRAQRPHVEELAVGRRTPACADARDRRRTAV